MEQEALEELRKRAKEEEEDEKRRLEEEVTKHQVWTRFLRGIIFLAGGRVNQLLACANFLRQRFQKPIYRGTLFGSRRIVKQQRGLRGMPRVGVSNLRGCHVEITVSGFVLRSPGCR